MPQTSPEQPAGNPYAGNVQSAPQYAAAAAAASTSTKPVATAISCGKCKIEKPAGKIGKKHTCHMIINSMTLRELKLKTTLSLKDKKVFNH